MAELLATKAQIKRQLQMLADRELSCESDDGGFRLDDDVGGELEEYPVARSIGKWASNNGKMVAKGGLSSNGATDDHTAGRSKPRLGVPSVDASLHFYANTQALGEIIRDFASVTASSSFPPLCQATGDGLRGALVGEKAFFKVITFDQQGEKRCAGGDSLSVRIENLGLAKGSAVSYNGVGGFAGGGAAGIDANPENPAAIKVKDLQDGASKNTAYFCQTKQTRIIPLCFF